MESPHLPRVGPLGDRAILVTIGDAVSEQVHRAVRSAMHRIRSADLAAVSDIVPCFASIAVHYDPALVQAQHAEPPYDALARALERSLVESISIPELAASLIEIPVCYGGAFGPDLEELAATHAVTPERVIELHTGSEYLVYMLGFLPGFAYLGGLAPELVTPRRAEPRAHVPAGSVGIGGEQTGVYPLESPGGWHLIGRTPVRMFRPEQDPPVLLAMGDRVRFRAISEAEFNDLESGAP